MSSKLLTAALLVSTLMTGCATVPMADSDTDRQAKSFVAAPDKANIYIYRNEALGAAIKMPVVVDGQMVGDTVAKSYVLVQTNPGPHTIVSKAENDSSLDINTEPGGNYYVWQDVNMGVMYARSTLHLVDEAKGRSGVTACKLVDSKQ